MLKPRIFTYLIRLTGACLFFAAFCVLTQDVQIFPGVLSGLLESTVRDQSSLPAGVNSRFIRTSDDELIEVWHMPYEYSETHAAAHPVAVLFHGNAEDVETSFPMLLWLNKLGMAAYSFDYRGFGKSSGWPSDQGLKSDALAVVNVAASEYNLKRHPLVLIGVSVGSSLAAYAAQHSEPSLLILMSPFRSLDALVGEMPILGFLSPLLWYDLNTGEYLKQLRSSCLIIVHGSADTIVPPDHGTTLMSDMTQLERKIHLMIDGAGHNDLMTRGHVKLGEAISRCLEY